MIRYNAKDFARARMHGYSDVFKIINTDLTTAVNNTQQAINLTALSIGDIVDNQVLMEVRTPSTGLTTCTASLGVTGAVTQFLPANDMVAGNLYFVEANTVAPYPTIAASKFLVINFTPGASEALNACTALEVWIWAKIFRITDRTTLQL